ncbi:MAG: diguanylate cyclase [Spirochaetales bacterium]|nr:diguanylate cyclase [Spirochaetales bacterium]
MQIGFFPVLIMAFISAYLSGRYLIVFFLKKVQIVNLHFSILCFAIACYDLFAFLMYNAQTPDSSLLWQRLQLVSGLFAAPVIALFIFSLLKKHMSLILKTLILSYGIAFLFTLLAPAHWIYNLKDDVLKTISFFNISITYFEASIQPITFGIFSLFILGIIYAFSILLRSLKNNKEVLPIVIGFSFFFLSCLVDFSITFGFFKFIYITEYSFLSIILFMDYSLMRQLAIFYKEQEVVQEKLERQVEKRTKEIQQLLGKLKEQNKRLTGLVEKDSLTDLYNHAAFYKHLNAFMNASQRHQFPLSIIIIDIDDFKAINDNYGHRFGDSVIKSIAMVLKKASRQYDEKARNKPEITLDNPEIESLRDYDIISRYGGDEFTILLLYCGEKEASAVSQRLKKMIGDLRFPEFPGVTIACSMGVVYLNPGNPCTNGEELFKIADKALYQAKKNGKNNFVITPFKPIEKLQL